jgi:HAD superfamily hydrolase (TIGR01450 family)
LPEATALPSPPAITVDGLLGRYDALLLDAYGVLLDKEGALPGAVDFIHRLQREGRPYLVLTNSASRLPEAMAADFRQVGLAIPPERLLSSGLLLGDYFRAHHLQGAPCLVLGPEDSLEYVRRAGGVPLGAGREASAEVLVVADQKGFDCLEGMNRALDLLIGRVDAGLPLHLLLCNPDLIYPLAPGRYAFTAGGLAAMLEAVLGQRYPGSGRRFVALGKPHPAIFEAARQRLGGGRLVMLGDQPATDILGANRYGIDSVLIATGLAPGAAIPPEGRPTWWLAGFAATP